MDVVITGVDTEKGILLCNNNVEFYLTILKKFRRNYSSFKVDFIAAVDLNDAGEAFRLSHSLSSVLAAIGASESLVLAQKLESMCNNNVSLTDVYNCLNMLSSNLDDIMDQIKDL